MTSATSIEAPLAHLFRRERGRIVSALTRLFGLHNLALAEDVAQDALVRALETWKIRGLPDNPAAWLMTTARNRALDVLRRERTARTFAPDLTAVLSTGWTLVPAVDAAFGDEAVRDDVLRLMFSCCHPQLAETSQVALILQLIAGFGVPEVAQAFLVGESAMEKRLVRAKATLAEIGALPELTAERVRRDLDAVRGALYLLFSEGYHGAHSEAVVRAELCAEALRLATLLVEHPVTGGPETKALYALMALNAARLPARWHGDELVPLDLQDRSRWDRALISHALVTLEGAAIGEELTTWHLEAAIAAEHALAESRETTDWAGIVRFYDLLLKLSPSPIVALNRAIAVGEADGPEAGLQALHLIDVERLGRYPFLPAARGELLLRAGRMEEAVGAFREALGCARNGAEARFFERRIAATGDTLA